MLTSIDVKFPSPFGSSSVNYPAGARGGGGRREGLRDISRIGMCAPKSVVSAPFWSENGYRLCQFWSRAGYRFRGYYGNV